MNNLIIFILIVGAVVNIALLVKFWIMASDISKIKKKYILTDSHFKRNVRDLYLLGKKDEAKEVLSKSFLNDIEIAFADLAWNEQNFETVHEMVVKQYIGFFEKIDTELPEPLKNLTFKQYTDFFGEKKN